MFIWAGWVALLPSNSDAKKQTQYNNEIPHLHWMHYSCRVTKKYWTMRIDDKFSFKVSFFLVRNNTEMIPLSPYLKYFIRGAPHKILEIQTLALLYNSCDRESTLTGTFYFLKLPPHYK